MDKIGLKHIIVQIHKTTNFHDLLKIFSNVARCRGTIDNPHTANELTDHLQLIDVLFFVLLIKDDVDAVPFFKGLKNTTPSFDNLKTEILHILFSLHDENPNDDKLSE